jgi:hypothetical protein
LIRTILIIFTSFVLGIYLVETTLYFIDIDSLDGRKEEASKKGLKFDPRRKIDVVEDLQEELVDAVLSVRPGFYLSQNGLDIENGNKIFPFGGISKKITVYCNESGEYAIYPSDRYGFNNPDLAWDKEQIKWLLIGDSFVQGACVSQGNDIAGKIRSLTEEPTINLGIGGAGPLIELAILKEYAKFKKPKKVIWVYYEQNDLVNNLALEKESPLLFKYLQDDFSQDLLNKQQEIDTALRRFVKNSESKKYSQIFLLTSIRQLINFSNDVYIDPLFFQILLKAKNQVELWGGRFYFVYLPEFSRYATQVDNHDQYRKRSTIISMVKDLDIPVIDIHKKVFKKHKDPMSLFPLKIHGHYTVEGYEKIAKSIISSINNQ